MVVKLSHGRMNEERNNCSEVPRYATWMVIFNSLFVLYFLSNYVMGRKQIVKESPRYTCLYLQLARRKQSRCVFCICFFLVVITYIYSSHIVLCVFISAAFKCSRPRFCSLYVFLSNIDYKVACITLVLTPCCLLNSGFFYSKRKMVVYLVLSEDGKNYYTILYTYEYRKLH